MPTLTTRTLKCTVLLDPAELEDLALVDGIPRVQLNIRVADGRDGHRRHRRQGGPQGAGGNRRTQRRRGRRAPAGQVRPGRRAAGGRTGRTAQGAQAGAGAAAAGGRGMITA
jgi:hypothetical protein